MSRVFLGCHFATRRHRWLKSWRWMAAKQSTNWRLARLGWIWVNSGVPQTMPSPKWFGDKSSVLLQPLNSKICYAASHEAASKLKTMRVCQKLTASPRPRSATCSHSNTATDINLFLFWIQVSMLAIFSPSKKNHNNDESNRICWLRCCWTAIRVWWAFSGCVLEPRSWALGLGADFFCPENMLASR